MTINYTTLLGLAQPVTGTEQGTWGDTVNTEITALLEDAVAKGVTINVTSGDVTLTSTAGTSNQARNAILLITGTPGVSRNVIAPSSSKVYIIVNGSNAAVVIKGAATTGVTVATGATSLVAWNGSDFVEVGQAGDVDGPASSTANAIARFSGTTGKIIQNSGITIDASNNVTGMGTLGVGAITTTGVFTATAGTVSAPAITTTGDTNTGIFFPAADTIAFAEGGAEAMRIDSSGNVGIGVTPSAWRTQNKTVQLGATGVFTAGTSATSLLGFGSNWYLDSGSQIRYIASDFASNYEQSSGRHIWYYAASGTAGNNFTFSEAMRIDSSGNVLIGTTSNPTLTRAVISTTGAGNALTLGDIATPANQTGLYLRSTTENRIGWDSSGYLSFVAATTERMRIDSSGNVGIGTSSPTDPLTIQATTGASAIRIIGRSSFDNSRIDFYNNANSSRIVGLAAGVADFSIYVDANIPLIFFTNNTERARIPAAGGFQCVNSISVGNATPTTSGAGITFPATQSASSNANTLDDYEQGTWTTTFSNATNLTGTPALDRSTYTKIGRFVYIQGRVTGYSVTTASTATSFVMTLPINMAEVTDTPSSGVYVAIAGTNNGGFLVDNTGGNANEIAFTMPAALVSSTGAMTIAISFSYIAAD